MDEKPVVVPVAPCEPKPVDERQARAFAWLDKLSALGVPGWMLGAIVLVLGGLAVWLMYGTSP